MPSLHNNKINTKYSVTLINVYTKIGVTIYMATMNPDS